MTHRITGSICVALTLVLDQGSKAMALSIPDLRNGMEILPVLNLVVVRNDGGRVASREVHQ